jgi:hypothetical protein
MSFTWYPWSSISDGRSTAGGPIAAVPWEGSFALFLSDPGGGLFAIKAVKGYGWESVPGLNTTSGAPVTALISGNRFTAGLRYRWGRRRVFGPELEPIAGIRRPCDQPFRRSGHPWRRA